MGKTASVKDLLDDAADTVLGAIPDSPGDAAGHVSDVASGARGIASRRPRRTGLLVLLVVIGALVGWRLSRS